MPKNTKQIIEKERSHGKLIMAVALCVILTLVIVGFALTNTSRKFQTFVSDYNGVTDEYNLYAESYNTLIDKLNGSVSQLPEKMALKEYYATTYETFKENGADFSEVKQELQSIQADRDALKTSYIDFCLSSYNELVGLFNQQCARYNLLLENLAEYGESGFSNESMEKIALVDDEAVFSDICKEADTINAMFDDLFLSIDKLQSEYYYICVEAYQAVVSDYNLVADAYNGIVIDSSVDYIEGMPLVAETKTDSIDFSNMEPEEVRLMMEELLSDTEELVADYLIVQQITSPDEAWVMERLAQVDSISGMQAVTEENNPDELLGKEGGYISCIYFSVDGIAQDQVSGDSIVEKGTDAGGAIEIYENMEYALNRCDYLSQFDGTLLYSGSYTLVGTMVIRTSYILSNQEQVDLIDDIITAFTAIADSEQV